MLLLDLQQKRIVRTTRSRRSSPAGSRTGSGEGQQDRAAGLSSRPRSPPKTWRRSGASSTPSATRRRRSSSSSRRWRPKGRRRWARWGTTRRWRSSRTGRSPSSLLQAALRPGDQPPDRPSPEELVMSLNGFIGRSGISWTRPRSIAACSASSSDPHPGGHAPPSAGSTHPDLARRRPRHASPAGGDGKPSRRHWPGSSSRPDQGDPGGERPFSSSPTGT